ncbi:unnamed protein product [Brassica oleracea var. botrytis]|uniref:(rape) hypothetical protein n=1 Tax=Brassica napus TaxID=3708 RepID=A0A816QKT0_BRANA|nr:unnamed protein product [Brassica napus]
MFKFKAVRVGVIINAHMIYSGIIVPSHGTDQFGCWMLNYFL